MLQAFVKPEKLTKAIGVRYTNALALGKNKIA